MNQQKEWYEGRLVEMTVLAIGEALTHAHTKRFGADASHITVKLRQGIVELIAESQRRRTEEILGVLEAVKATVESKMQACDCWPKTQIDTLQDAIEAIKKL